MHKFSKNILCFLPFLLCLLESSPAQPNFVLIVLDDMGWTGTSVQMDSSRTNSRSDFYVTPAIEQLGQSGLIFSQAYAPAPKCSPSRCSILTGRSTARNHFTTTDNQITPDRLLVEGATTNFLDGADTTLAEWLKLTGLNYRTAHFGKWHLGSAATSSPANNGFDMSDGATSNGDGNQGATVQTDPKKIFSLTNQAINFIQNSVTDGVPFYLQLSHYAVHTDIEATQASIDLYNDANQRPPGQNHTDVEYAAMTEDTDTGIGQLLASISNLGLDSNTYVMLISDNGGQMNVTNNAPLHRGKTFIYEGGIRVPMFIKGPGVPANRYISEAVVAYDIFPTIAELTGSSTPLPANLDGQSLLPLLSENTFDRRQPIFFHSPHYENNPNKTPRSAVVDGVYKLLVEYETGNTYLFDLSSDVGEDTDLSAAQPDRTHELCVILRNHLKAAEADMPSLDATHANFSGIAPDIDGDGLEDAWEFRELLSYTYGPTDDPDGDGKDNMTEYNEGSDPYVDETVSSVGEEILPWIKVYPNPATERLNIQLEPSTLTTELLLQIIDLKGQTVIEVGREYAETLQLSIQGLSAGLYFLKVQGQNNAFQSIGVRFVIE
ncbi:MAG: sulfatase-like hydrolase/transferase [Bacteroidota bacterium]